MFLLFGLPFMLSNLLMLIGTLVVCLSLSWQLTICALVPVPFIVLGGLFIWKRMRAHLDPLARQMVSALLASQ